MHTMSNRAAILSALIAPTMLLTVGAEAQSLSDRIEGVARQRQATGQEGGHDPCQEGHLLLPTLGMSRKCSQRILWPLLNRFKFITPGEPG